ncbi:MAG: magnesium transporter [Deltaproteobacteria bacterium]|nr:magnesium transporter [Deltaproteobacteria bacterium]
MLSNRLQLLLESTRRLVRRGNVQNLRKLALKARAPDLAHLFRFLGEHERRQVLKVLGDKEKQAELISELDVNLAVELISQLNPEESAEILAYVPNDDVADILGELDEEDAETILSRMKAKEQEQVSQLMHYQEDTAGGIMSPDFFALQESCTTQEAIERLRNATDVEMAFYIYVQDEHGHLVGVCSLRQLVVTKPDVPLSEIMVTSVIRVNTETDQEEVARLVHMYGFLALPVVDEHNVLVGIVTVDDVIDVIKEEATEDILKMAGAGEDLTQDLSPIRAIRGRLPWLFAAWLGEIASVWVIGSNQAALRKVAILASFIPVIMAMGGNVGNQAATLVVRGLALGRINVGQLGRVLGRQSLIGVVLGIFFGGLLALVALLFFGKEMGGSLVDIPFVVGAAICIQMTLAAFIGTMLPMIFEKLKVDPAVATAPFLSTSMDFIGILVYFNMAVYLLNLRT